MLRRLFGWIIGKQEITINLKVSGNIDLRQKNSFNQDEETVYNTRNVQKDIQASVDFGDIQVPEVKFGNETEG